MHSYVFWDTVARAKRILFFLCERFISKDFECLSYFMLYLFMLLVTTN